MCAEGIDMRWHICIRSTPYMIDYSWRKGVTGNNAKTMLSSMQSVVHTCTEIYAAFDHFISRMQTVRADDAYNRRFSSNTTPVRTRC